MTTTVYWSFLVNLLPYNKTALVAGWTDHGRLTTNPVHISKILYVRTDTTDSSLKWKVTVTTADPAVAESFGFLFSVDEDKVDMKDLSVNSIFALDIYPYNLYSFSAYNERGSSQRIHVVVFHNGDAVRTAQLDSSSLKQNIKSVRY